MSLAELLKVLPPPSNPHCAVSDPVQWQAVGAKLGTRLPTDYKDFIGTYGTGTIGDFITIFSPFSPFTGINLAWNVRHILEWERELQRNIQGYFPLPLFPESDGLLPFGSTYNGDTLFWQTQGEPDNWTVVTKKVRSEHYEMYSMNLSGFLVQLLVKNPDRKKDLLRNSHIFKYDFKRDALFHPLTTNMVDYLPALREALKKATYNHGAALNKDAVEAIFRSHGFVLHSDIIQQQLETWQREGLIELPKGNEVYLRVVGEI